MLWERHTASPRDNQMVPSLQVRSTAKYRGVKSGFEEVVVVTEISYNVHTNGADFDVGNNPIDGPKTKLP